MARSQRPPAYPDLELNQHGPREGGRRRLVARSEELLDRLIGQRNVQHALLAIEAGDGSFGWSGARGIANPAGQSLEVDDLVPLASVTKLYTSVLVHRLAEAALIDLDAPITTYLDDLAGLHRSDGVDLTDRITRPQPGTRTPTSSSSADHRGGHRNVHRG